MTATVPHQSLRYLIRATGTPELTTNDLLEALLIADRAMYRAFLDAVGTLTGTDLVDTRLGRESYTVDAEPFAWTATADEIIEKVAILDRDFRRLVDNNQQSKK